MPRIISPPKEMLNTVNLAEAPDVERIPAKLLKIISALDSLLDQDWELYVKPFLNGLRPDLVLLNKDRGVVIFEFCELGDKAETESIEARLKIASNNLTAHKRELRDIYCSRHQGRNRYEDIESILIFSAPKAIDKITIDYHYLVNIDDVLTKEYLNKRCHFLFKNQKSNAMNSELARDIRNWLVEPDFSEEERRPLELKRNSKQTDVIKTRTETGYRRIKGPAGSGKSLVIAAKAAELAAKGHKVLIVTYNVTLIHYLRRLFYRYLRFNLKDSTPAYSIRVEFRNYHDFCKKVVGGRAEYNDMWRDHFDTDGYADVPFSKKDLLEDKIPDLLMNEKPAKTEKYDAILVDEGQDFNPKWWQSLRKFIRENGEALLCADTTQDIYGKSASWTEEAMENAGFRGDWMKFDVSYRMPPRLIKLASGFASKYLPANLIDIPKHDPQGEFNYDFEARWILADRHNLLDVAAKEIRDLAAKIKDEAFSISDITALVENTDFGIQLARLLEKDGITVAHTFDRDSKKAKDLKMSFAMEKATVKITSLQSFKGWETRALVMVLANAGQPRDYALFYTGMTRVKWHQRGSFLTVVSSAEQLNVYGKTWGRESTIAG